MAERNLMAAFGDGLIHGCDYNPEQWLHRRDILQRDIDLMREAGINMVSIGIFSWQKMEPEEGVYTFDWMDETVERLHAGDIKICLATATAAYPHWMARKHPEVVRKSADGAEPASGGRHNFCWSSPVYREKTAAIISLLAGRYGRHPALAAWHINNEYGGNRDANRCYCERCVERFQQWLRQRYDNDLETLNRSWWTAFWSHGYSAWEEIVPNDYSVGALTMNWLRFSAEQVEDFLLHEIAAIRRFSDAPVTTNLHGNGMLVDDYLLARHLDFVSFDCYPTIDGSAGDHWAMVEAAWESDRMRSLLQKPWLLMESCPAQPQYKKPMRAKRPGMHRMLSLMHVAHGSDGVCYFQWRAGRGGSEKLHGAVCMWDAPEHTRVFDEVSALGRDLRALGSVEGSACRPEIAIVWDIWGQWHFDYNNGLNGVRGPRERALEWYGCLFDANIPVDVVSPAADLEGYKLILLPGVFMLPDGFAVRLRAAVEAGATLVSDALTAWLDEDHKFLPGGRLGPELRDLFGIRCEEFDCPRPDESVAVESESGYIGDGARAREFCDIVVAESANILAVFAETFYTGRPVLTEKRAGAGRALYLTADLETSAKELFFSGLLREAGIEAPWKNMPDGVLVRERIGNDGRRILFFFNPGETEKAVALDDSFMDLLSGTKCDARLILSPLGSRVLIEKQD